jgi:threonine synthase
MRYVSTRGDAPVLGFDDVLLAGLARDGGLYVPETWPRLAAVEWQALAGLPYAEVALRILKLYVGDAIAEADLRAMVEDSYRQFGHPAVVPLKQVGPNDWLLELFHGPTLAFKDVALQLVGRLFDHVLKKRGSRVTIVGATSGDTGSAAIEACRDREAIDIFILYPHGRVSEVQRRQMTTVPSANVHNIAIEGTFDDCQDLVKAMFNDAGFRDRMRLSAVNSINWARIAAQIVYYAVAALRLGAPARQVAFSVPTGNFGNIFAGYAAQRMGLPITRFVVGSNRNDILFRLLDTGTMKMEGVAPTLSPSMDIQVSSNFERMLFELSGRNGKAVATMMARFRKKRELTLSPARRAKLAKLFTGARADDSETMAMIRRMLETTGELIDPHTAVGLVAAAAQRGDTAIPMITAATAHPAKFPDAVEKACGVRPALPPRLAGLFEKPERLTVLPNDLAAVQNFVSGKARTAA